MRTTCQILQLGKCSVAAARQRLLEAFADQLAAHTFSFGHAQTTHVFAAQVAAHLCNAFKQFGEVFLFHR
jgi:hypothetical protein